MLTPNVSQWNCLLKLPRALRKHCILKKGFSNFRGAYYTVNSKNPSDGGETDSNWELLAPSSNGVRFFLPGSIGPAGHDDVSLSFMTSSVRSCHLKDIKLEALECPTLLRAGLSDLFPTPEVVAAQSLTIIKIIFRRPLPTSSEYEMEQLSKQFVCLAEDICDTLKGVGYWADFINPFSGSARYLAKNEICSEDGITCLRSTTEDNGICKVIITKHPPSKTSKHLGNLYTNAPKSIPVIQDMLKASKS